MLACRRHEESHHVHRVQSHWTCRAGAHRAGDVLANGRHHPLSRQVVPKPRRRGIQGQLLRRRDWRALLDLRPEAKRRRQSLRDQRPPGDRRGYSRRILARHSRSNFLAGQRSRSPKLNDNRVHAPITNSIASDNCVLLGGAKPGSRPQNWASTVVPGIERKPAGVPPSEPARKAFMSTE